MANRYINVNEWPVVSRLIDCLVPGGQSAELADALKAEVHVLPTGHFLMQESPDGALNALRGSMGQAG